MKPYYIIIRGPLGIGKSTIAKALTKKLRASYISLDKVLADHGLDKRGDEPCIPARNFIKADEIVMDDVKKSLDSGKVVIFDGCFYHKEQLNHLEKELRYDHVVINLKAPLEVCIARDAGRTKSYGEGAAAAVHNLVSRFDYGINIQTQNKTKQEVIKEILANLPK